MSFPIIGNARIKESVLTAVAEKKLPHAFLISGEKGTGKRTLAHFLASAAVCDSENPPCDTCRNCHLASVGSHPDIAVIAPEDGKKNISVGQIRNLRNDAYVKPHMADCRVFIIEQADSMNEQAQNALLKVLEEPPASIYFILLAESAYSLLETVISRCTVLALVPPDADISAEYLKSNYYFDENAVNAAVRESGGNIGLALEILNDNGTSVQAAAESFVELLLKGNGAELLKITAPFEKSRVEADIFLKELTIALTAEIKKNTSNRLTAKLLNIFYYKLPEFADALRTNINLGLLFSDMVATAIEAYNQQ